MVDPCDFDNGWHPFNTSCFKYSTVKRSWLDAQQQCVDGNGQLAVINTKDKWSLMEELVACKDFQSGIWIGLSDTVSRLHVQQLIFNSMIKWLTMSILFIKLIKFVNCVIVAKQVVEINFRLQLCCFWPM